MSQAGFLYCQSKKLCGHECHLTKLMTETPKMLRLLQHAEGWTIIGHVNEIVNHLVHLLVGRKRPHGK